MIDSIHASKVRRLDAKFAAQWILRNNNIRVVCIARPTYMHLTATATHPHTHTFQLLHQIRPRRRRRLLDAREPRLGLEHRDGRPLRQTALGRGAARGHRARRAALCGARAAQLGRCVLRGAALLERGRQEHRLRAASAALLRRQGRHVGAADGQGSGGGTGAGGGVDEVDVKCRRCLCVCLYPKYLLPVALLSD